MKYKGMLILMSLLSFGESVHAQTQFGIKSGINYTSSQDALFGTNGEAHYKFGYHLGLFGSVGFDGKFTFRSELLFSNKGYKYETQAENEPKEESSAHLNYLNLPLLGCFEVYKGLNLVAGPELGYLVSAKAEFDSKPVDIKQLLDHHYDFGLSGGLSYAINEHILMELRYTHGLVSALKNFVLTNEDGEPIKPDPKFHNRTFQLSLGYRLK